MSVTHERDETLRFLRAHAPRPALQPQAAVVP
jgi:hypothetical protein